MIVWLGDWGAPEKIHPNLEPGWVGFGWTFPARNELICTSFETDELDENMFQKRCAFVLLPNMLWYLLWYLSYMLCFYQGTQKIPPLRRWWTDKGCFWAENSKSQQRICCKHPTSSRAYGSMISTSQIQSSQAFYGFFTSGYHLHGAASDFGGSTSICPFLGRSRCKRLQQLTSPLMCEAEVPHPSHASWHHFSPAPLPCEHTGDLF